MRVGILFLGLLVFTIPAIAQSPDPYELQRQMLERQFEAQMEQSRIQASGMALFGSGPAMINGMNQWGQTMQQPQYAPQPFVPVMPVHPVQPTTRCTLTNPGAMQSIICY